MNRKKKTIIGILIILAILMIYAINFWQPKLTKMSYNDFLIALDSNKVKKVYLKDENDILKIELKDGKKYIIDNPKKEGFKEQLLRKNVEVDEMQQLNQIQSTLSFASMVALFSGLLYFMSKKATKQLQSGSGKLPSMSGKPVENIDLRFDDIAGNEEAKESVKEIIDFIKKPEKYSKYGARLPRGVIFYGPPGTGKTLMAKAVAGEAGVPFFAVSGSDFVQIYVGVGASRIRDLFKKAREYGKCVIFIDEIDALGKKRDGGLDSSGNDERDQTLNALLAEMSGFGDNEGIVVIAATNRLDILDEALLRPGRFDRHIEIGLPDIKGRFEILKLYSLNKPMAEDIDLYALAQQTVYFSGAKLENMINEAAIMAARRDSGYIEKQDIDRAFYTIIAGAEKKDRSSIKEQDRRITAFHEAGHALITKLLMPENKVSRITIIPSTKGAGGFSMNIPPDRMYYQKKEMENNIRIALGGRASEEIIFGSDSITSGASNDLEKATQIILNMVRRFGMKDKSGLLNYDVLYHNGIQQVSNDIVQECKDTMNILYDDVKATLIEYRELLEKITCVLLEKETIDEQELDLIINSYMDKSKGIA